MQEDVLSVKGASTPKRKTVLTEALAKKPEAAVDYGEDAGNAAPVTEDTLATLKTLAQQLLDTAREVDEKEAALRAATKRHDDIAETTLPKIMEQHGLEKFEFFDTTTGLKIIIKRDDKLRVGLPTKKVGNRWVADDEARLPVWAWLREIGQGGVIKKNIEFPVGQFPDESVAQIVALVKAQFPDIDAAVLEKVEPPTLTALVMRLRTAGQAVHEAIKVEPVKRAKVVAK